jgi:hypothetical protein
MKNLVLLIFLLSLLISCSKKESTLQPSTLNWEAIADKLVERMDLQKGERILFLAKPGRFDTLISILQNKVKSKNGEYLGTISVDSIQPVQWETEFTKNAAALDSNKLEQYLSSIDLGVMMPGPTPNDKVYAAIQNILRKGKARTIHFHWEGAIDLLANSISISDSIDQLYQNAILNSDYNSIKETQKKFETDAQEKWIEVSTPAGTKLRFQITGRPVTKQDGDASLVHSNAGRNLIDREVEFPAGAIRVAPIEETVEGVIVFPVSQWQTQVVKNLVLTFKNGKIISVKADEGEDAVNLELAAGGEAAKSFRELAIGFNPALVPAKGNTWIPYYGYGAGIVRLSLGDNSELGGNVKGEYTRWNLFTTASVKIGDALWVKEGKLVTQ